MNDKWNKRFLDLAQMISTWSKDPSTQVGAVLVDNKRRVIGVGYNGLSRKITDTVERYADRSVKYEIIVHAEINAILNSIVSPAGATLYSTFPPCPRCAAVIIQAGIAKIVYPKDSMNDRWKEAQELSLILFVEAGIPVLLD